MNSCIYHAKIGHKRTNPVKNGFTFSSFFLYLDLDELDELDMTYRLFSRNKRNIFSFYDTDHINFVHNTDATHERITKENVAYTAEKYIGKPIKEQLLMLIDELGLEFDVGRIMLLTNVRVFGYVFNPVSFYYCFDTDGVLRVMFSEVNNTFHQQKIYYLLNDDLEKKRFRDRQKKNYYVSPFIDYDTDLTREFEVPDDHLIMLIDSVKGDKTMLRTSVVGKKQDLSASSLRDLLWKYPFVTILIIMYIHRQALKLRIKKVKLYKKDETDERIVQAMEEENN